MNNKIEITAKCEAVGRIEEIGEKKFKKRIFVLVELKEDQKYPTRIAFTLKKDKVTLIDETAVGKTLNVTGYVESREWNGKYFTDVTAVKVEVATAAPDAEEVEPIGAIDEADDMPF